MKISNDPHPINWSTLSAVGAYEHPDPAFEVVPAATWFVRGGREHVALRPETDSIVVSYATDGAAAPGLHLVVFRFFGALP